MENLYQSPEWSPFSLIGESEVSEASSHTLVANTSIGSPAPLEEEFPSQYNNFTGNYHLLQTYGFPSHSSTVRDLVLTISEQRTQIDSLTTTIARRALEVEELRLREISRHRLGRHEILDAFAERGAMGREEWELVGCETGHHYGDAVEDALLYIRGLRRDYRSVWKRLYAVTPERVMELFRTGDHASISVLDKRATLLLTRDKYVPGLVAIEYTYHRFVYLLEQNVGEQPEEDSQSPLTRAYRAFWEDCGETVF